MLQVTWQLTYNRISRIFFTAYRACRIHST